MIVDFFESKNNDKSYTINHFKQQGIGEKTIRNVLNRFIKEGRVEFKKKSGRKRTSLTKKQLKKIENKFRKKPNASVRVVGDQLGTAWSNVQRAKRELKIKSRRKQKVPQHNQDQVIRAERACRALYKKTVNSGGNYFIVMDDETYVPMDPTQVPGLQFYNEFSDSPLPIEDKIKPTIKFPKKFLVWQAIGQDGRVSEPFITSGTINQHIYLKECIQARLLPFLKSYGDEHKILFWPDMASSHYAKTVVEELKKNKIEFVTKEENAPNVPHCRPIEKFWAICKSHYKARNKMCKSLRSFSTFWRNISKKVALESGKELFLGLSSKLYSAGHRGILSPLNI